MKRREKLSPRRKAIEMATRDGQKDNFQNRRQNGLKGKLKRTKKAIS
jgi:hypothetical protein